MIDLVKTKILIFFLALISVTSSIGQESPSERTIDIWIKAQERWMYGVIVSDFGLTSIPAQLWDMSWIRYLVLDYNAITSIPDRVDKLWRLEGLSLVNNEIDAIQPALTNLEELSSLNLINNLIHALPEYLEKMKALEYLDLKGNPIDNERTLYFPPNLKELNIDSTLITQFPERILKLEHLTKLSISYNSDIDEIPESIGELVSLKILNISHSQIEKLPEAIGEVKSLKFLYLNGNELTGLPLTIVQLPVLQHLEVNDNRLEELPENIGQLSKLVLLSLRNNKLQGLPETFSSLEKLHTLHLSDNQLSEVPIEIKGLNKLVKLDLSHNQIDSLPPWVFTDLPALRYLTLPMNLKAKISKEQQGSIVINYVKPQAKPRVKTRPSTSTKDVLVVEAPKISSVPPPPPPPPPARIDKNMEIKPDSIFEQRVERMPKFDNSFCNKITSEKERQKCIERTLPRYVKFHLEYPERAIRERKRGTVKVSVIVEKDGTVSDVKIVKNSLGVECGKAAIKVVEKMNSFGPMFIPGRHRGQLVRVRMELDIPFYIPKGAL